MEQSKRFAWPIGALALAACALACERSVTVVSTGDGGAESWAGGGAGPVGATTSSGIVAVGGGGPGLVERVIGHRQGGGPVPVLVGDRSLGVTMVARASDGATSVGFATLMAPSGALVIDGPLPGDHATWRRPGISSMAAPQIESPESFPLARGVWTFGVDASVPVDLAVWERKTQDGAFHGGVIDLNVFASAGVTKKKHVLTVAANAFGDFAGIELGDVRFFDLGDGFLEIDDDNVAAALAETARAPTRPSVNVIATRMIGGKYEGSAGYSTGIPGSPMAPGSRQAAIVWMVTGDDVLDPSVLRHEVGHFAGLFHTSELIAGEVDSLDDTPSCDDVLSTYAQCPDFAYTMFPTGGSGAGLFSPHEEAVIQASAIYRGVFAEGGDPMTPYGPPLGGVPLSMSGFGEGEPASAEDLARARTDARLVARRPIADRGWGRELGANARAHLFGVGCPSGGADYFATLEGLGISRPDTLLAIASSGEAPMLARARAVIALGRLAAPLTEEERGEIAEQTARIARDAAEPSALRSYALESTARIAHARALALARELAADRDELVARAALRL